MTMTSVHPMNGAVPATIEETTPRELEDVLAAAGAAAPVLRAMSAAERVPTGAFAAIQGFEIGRTALIADRPADVMLTHAIRDPHRTAMRDFPAHAAIEPVTNGQPAPDHALPPWLRNANPDRIPHRVEGVLTDEPIGERP
ncbi:hypothetical protein KN815_00290 [Streptomyces sp. 4503]|uniref:Uncharacterized protein n=1 Tax=Streptomyces niphimycinicus TaxID=2842201 RepID=A0ABS6C6U6_9ACTN|nr:hypothetical protein [Streptomyces niphimycinicus]MBU3862609.1 hypothetical protein [Streptomyces niphimycinicus]